MNTTTKKLITFNNGASAVMLFNGRGPKGFIQSYQPSPAYEAYIKKIRAQEAALLAAKKPKIAANNISINTHGYHATAANKLFQRIMKEIPSVRIPKLWELCQTT